MNNITLSILGLDHPKQKLENLASTAAVSGVFDSTNIRVEPPRSTDRGDNLGMQVLMDIIATHADKIGPIVLFCMGWLKDYVVGNEIEVSFESENLKISVKAKNRADIEKVIESLKGLQNAQSA